MAKWKYIPKDIIGKDFDSKALNSLKKMTKSRKHLVHYKSQKFPNTYEGDMKLLLKNMVRFDEVNDSVQRIKFSMAAYNCGYSHVVDAQKLAEVEGFESDIWDDNVEEMILKLSYRENYSKPFIKFGYVRGREPYNYVQDIFVRYGHYKEFIN